MLGRRVRYLVQTLAEPLARLKEGEVLFRDPSGSPVRGFRPVRASRRFRWQVPNPRNSTRSPRDNALLISPKIAATIRSKSRWYRCGLSLAARLITSDFVIAARTETCSRASSKDAQPIRHRQRAWPAIPMPTGSC